MANMDLSLGLDDTHVLITGAAGLIGQVVTSAFLSAHARVTAVDLDWSKLTALSARVKQHPKLNILVADVANEKSLAAAFRDAKTRFGAVVCVVALAGLDLSVLPRAWVADKSLEDWHRTTRVNLDGTFLAAKMWMAGVREVAAEEQQKKVRNTGLVICGSESGHWGEPGAAEYATSKGAVMGGLLQSLKVEAVRIQENARVNAIAPGPVETERFRQECEDDPKQLYVDSQATTAMGVPVPPEAVAKAILFLASENWSGNIHGQTLNVDSGKLGKLLWAEGER